jgi:hypothetical protein
MIFLASYCVFAFAMMVTGVQRLLEGVPPFLFGSSDTPPPGVVRTQSGLRARGISALLSQILGHGWAVEICSQVRLFLSASLSTRSDSTDVLVIK